MNLNTGPGVDAATLYFRAIYAQFISRDVQSIIVRCLMSLIGIRKLIRHRQSSAREVRNR